jgi:hypothetical protein
LRLEHSVDISRQLVQRNDLGIFWQHTGPQVSCKALPE